MSSQIKRCFGQGCDFETIDLKTYRDHKQHCDLFKQERKIRQNNTLLKPPMYNCPNEKYGCKYTSDSYRYDFRCLPNHTCHHIKCHYCSDFIGTDKECDEHQREGTCRYVNCEYCEGFVRFFELQDHQNKCKNEAGSCFLCLGTLPKRELLINHRNSEECKETQNKMMEILTAIVGEEGIMKICEHKTNGRNDVDAVVHRIRSDLFSGY